MADDPLRFMIPLGIITWPHLATPAAPPPYTGRRYYSCVVLTDFPEAINAAAREANGGVDPDYPIAPENSPKRSFFTWGFRYRISCQSPFMPACVDRTGRAIDPLSITIGSRVRVGVDLEPGRVPDSFVDMRRYAKDERALVTYVKPALRLVQLLGAPIERSPSAVPIVEWERSRA